ncbi:VOC family protein [Pseudonocardia spirodelae]|uniref:VOC family protein n=1 Tax=Pseudonocardia spirodelae TaxID=3133431 RepID=A0ABU8T9D7_9PSEU
MAIPWTITVDCSDTRRLAAFWSAALGYVPSPPPRGFATWEDWLVSFDVPREEWGDGAALDDPDGVGPRISFLKVPEPRTVKNRLHLDLQVTGGRDRDPAERDAVLRAEAERLCGLGARVVHEALHPGSPHVDHLWMADPEGNDFCVV